MDKERQMIEFEITNCWKNIEFYKQEIKSMESKINELELVRQQFEEEG